MSRPRRLLLCLSLLWPLLWPLLACQPPPDANLAADAAAPDAAPLDRAADDAPVDAPAPRVDASPADSAPQPPDSGGCDPRTLVNPCPDGQVCRLEGDRGRCVADCRAAGACPPRFSCHPETGLCIDPSSGDFGAACDLVTDGCDGIPNGTCIMVSVLHSNICSVPCAPFTTPCPAYLPRALCAKSLFGYFCVMLCDPEDPEACPASAPRCEDLGGGAYVCMP